MIRFAKSKNMIIGIILSAIVFTTGCGIAPVSVRYTPTGVGQRIVIGAPEVKLQVKDAREKKVFFRTILGDNDDEGKNGILRLITPPKEVFEEGFTQALQSSGYSLREDAVLVYEVRIKRFLANDPQKSPHFLGSDIILEVLIKRSGEVLARKTIFERDTEKMTFGQVWQNVVPTLLSRSLSNAIEKAIQDKDLIAALGADRTIVAKTPDKESTGLPRKQYTLPEKPIRDSSKKVGLSQTKQQIAVKTASAVTESQANARAPESDFIISVKTGLPHRFPEGQVKGLWLSSVPLQLGVSVSLKGSNRKHFLGKTPLLANLKNGTYEIEFGHPTIKDKKYKPRYRSQLMGTLRTPVKVEVFPFIAPRKTITIVIEGKYLWFQTEEVTVQDDFQTVIVLFQREDQTTSDMLSSLPLAENFTLSSANKDAIDENISETFTLTEEDAAQAEQMLKRAGVWAKKFDDNQYISVEIKPHNIVELRGRYSISGEQFEKKKATILPKPEPISIQTPKPPVADVPAIPQPVAKPAKVSDSKVGSESVSTESPLEENQDIQKQPRMGLTSFDKEIQGMREKANEGDMEAQYELGLLYYRGPLNYRERESKDYRERKEDYKKEATKWWKKAAEQGHLKAQCTLGAIYFQGIDTVKDYEESYKWHKKAAGQGNENAQYNLGEHYEYGYGVAKDPNEAYKWYKNAAEKGHVAAEYKLGIMYSKGQGVVKDYAKAIKWYKKAGEQGHGKAQFDLASMYYEGKGVSQDYIEAVGWYRRAANIRLVIIPLYVGAFYYVEEEDIEACYKLGQMYQNGYGVVKDNNEAFKWYKKAANRGHKEAQFVMGNMYFKDEGVKQDDIEAYKWYILSGNQGCTEATLAKEKIKTEMTYENISEAERRAGNFKIAKNKYSSPEYFFDVRPAEIKTRTYRELTDEDIAEAKRKGFSLPTVKLPKIDIPKYPIIKPPKIDIPKINVIPSQSSLHKAAEQNNIALVKSLIEKGTNINATDQLGWSPLHYAAYRGHKQTAELLLSNGAIVNAKANNDVRPLHLASEQGQTALAELLLDKGADVNTRQVQGWTSLGLAAQKCHLETVKLLLDKGANVNSKSKSGLTPLHTAVSKGCREVVELLLSKGAEVKSKSNNGRTPLHTAAYQNQQEAAKLLLSAGADPSVKDIEGKTPIDFATDFGNVTMAKLLAKTTASPQVEKQQKATTGLPTNGVYSKDVGSGGSYKDSIHGFFEVEHPKGFKIVEQRNRTTTRLDNGTVVPCSRIHFQSDNARIAVVTRKAFRGTIEEDLKVVLQKYRSVGAKIESTRFITIDGIKGAEVRAIASGYRLMLVKYKKHGLDHAITISCSPNNFSKFQEVFLSFLRSYRSLKPK